MGQDPSGSTDMSVMPPPSSNFPSCKHFRSPVLKYILVESKIYYCSLRLQKTSYGNCFQKVLRKLFDLWNKGKYFQ